MLIPYMTVVRQQEVAIVERLGQFARTVGAGPHLVLPWESVATKLSLKVQEMQVTVETKTLDDVFVPDALLAVDVRGSRPYRVLLQTRCIASSTSSGSSCGCRPNAATTKFTSSELSALAIRLASRGGIRPSRC